ncbi:MAG TPA: hybrid sensor histidine kinase/response regulator, partial [Proteobacteria bacterium]|nr:hybrid sensor histidine kinase/response regulator [Pseudomonadota bacterium]
MADGIDRNELLELFRGEAEEYLATLNERLPRLGAGDGAGVVEECFRVAHTLKGSAAMVGLTGVQEVAHGMEDLLGRVRDTGVDHGELLFAGLDLIESCLDEQTAVADGAVGGYLALVQAALHGAPSNAPQGGVAAAPPPVAGLELPATAAPAKP